MTDTTTTPAVLAEYLEMWLEPDEGARARPGSPRVFTEDGRHVDPNADARGHEGLAAMITAVHAQFPGFGMHQTSGVDLHNDQLRFGWELVAADGTPVVAGIDVGELAEDGRLRRISGFWGDLPAA